MMAESRIPPGSSLLLIGSGLYWILSSQLISSFTVLTPGFFQFDQLGASLITIVGIAATTVGLWILQVDFDVLRILFSRSDGWIFTVPLALVASDVYLALSQGLGLIMRRVGSYLFGPMKSFRYLPFVMICGAAAFGPANNLVLFLDHDAGVSAYFVGFLGCAMLSLILFSRVKRLEDDLCKHKFQQL